MVQRGAVIPERYGQTPELLPWLRYVYSAFLELSTCRHVDMGPIPWLAIERWGSKFGYSEDQFEDFVYYIRQLDNDYLDFMNEKMRKERQKSTKKAKSDGPAVTKEKVLGRTPIQSDADSTRPLRRGHRTRD